MDFLFISAFIYTSWILDYASQILLFITLKQNNSKDSS